MLPGVIYGKLFGSNEDLSFWFIVWLDAQSGKLAKSTAVLLKIKGPIDPRVLKMQVMFIPVLIQLTL